MYCKQIIWDLRGIWRPYHPIAILKPDLSQHDIKQRRGSQVQHSQDPDYQEASDWSASFTVTIMVVFF